MAYFTQALLAMGYSRSMVLVAGPDVVAGTWRAYIVGHENGNVPIRDADEGANYFLTVPTPNPAGYSPAGDLITFTSHMGLVVLGAPLAQDPLNTARKQEGVIFGWVSLPSFPGPIFAVVYVTPEAGADVLLLVDPSELTLIRKNPFFP